MWECAVTARPEVPEAGADAWRAISKIFPWGNGAPVTDRVLGDLLKEEVRAAPLFVPLYNYYREYGADQAQLAQPTSARGARHASPPHSEPSFYRQYD